MTNEQKLKNSLYEILEPTFGLQGIMEDYSDLESKEFHEACHNYYKMMVYRYQQIARTTLKEVGE